MKTITLQRVRQADRATIGLLCIGKTKYATLEDEVRDAKIYGETAIPAGTYEIKLRTAGGKTLQYARRFPDMHKGMLWLQDVPGFSWVYIHIGNFPEDTEGCILVGTNAGTNHINNSRVAYTSIYPKIVEMIEDDGCQIVILNEDKEGNSCYD